MGRKPKLLNHSLWPTLGVIALVTGIVSSDQGQSQATNLPVNGLQVLSPAEVDWKAVARDFRPERFSALSRTLQATNQTKGLEQTRIPVLLPNTVATDKVILIPGVHTYTANLPQPNEPGLSVLISGDSVFVSVPDGVLTTIPAQQINIDGQSTPATFVATDGGQRGSFMRYGVAYTIEIDCADDDTQARFCATDAFARQVVAGMSDMVLSQNSFKQISPFVNPSVKPPVAPVVLPKINPTAKDTVTPPVNPKRVKPATKPGA